MVLLVVSMYDVGVGAFGRPVFVRSRGEAVRSLSDEVNSKREDSAIANHPQDFQLFFVAEFDDSSGKFSCPEMPEKIADAASLVVKVN